MYQVTAVTGKLAINFCVLFTLNFIINDITEADVSTKSLYMTAVLAAPAITAYVEFLARRKQRVGLKK